MKKFLIYVGIFSLSLILLAGGNRVYVKAGAEPSCL